MDVQDALDMYEDYKSYWSEIYEEARTDLRMAAGDPATHWGDVYLQRVNAKKITTIINELPQFIHQVTNDIRQNVPSIKAIPDADGNIETAEIIAGLFRAIEYRSHSDEVVDTASEYAVKCSIGFMGVDHDYCDDESDEQEIIFKTVPDPLACLLDPASVEYDGRDADGFILLEPITKKQFEKQFKGKKWSSFTDPKATGKLDSGVLAQIFIREWEFDDNGRRRNPTIKRFKFSGADKLAETTFPGKYIPYVPIYGEVTWLDGKRRIASLIRQARGPQLRLNHWAAKEQEILNMAPIAPVMAARGTLVNDRSQWQSPGTEMVLEYEPEDLNGNPTNPPTRLNPPPIPTGIINAMEGAKQNIKESLGMYNASIGERSNETSGIAIQRRQHEGDVATFHFPDNVRRSYGHLGEIVLEMIPVIYDTPRLIQIVNEETDSQMVGINGAPRQEGQDAAYDLTKGKYHVRITTGASYTTKRQEEAAFLSQIAQTDPNFMKIGGDILFKSMDAPGAQALSARYKKTIPPQLLEDKDQPQIPPQVQQEMEQMQQVIQVGGQKLQELTQENEQLKQKAESADTQAVSQKAQDDVQAKIDELKAAEKIASLELENQRKDMEIQRMNAVKEIEGHVNKLQPTPTNEEPMASEDELLAKLQAVRDGKAQAQAQQDQQAMAEQMKAQQEEQERQEKQAYQVALLQGIAGVQQAVQQLTQAVVQPKQATFAPDGTINVHSIH